MDPQEVPPSSAQLSSCPQSPVGSVGTGSGGKQAQRNVSGAAAVRVSQEEGQAAGGGVGPGP